MDELIKKITAFGVPGIILTVAIATTGLAGAAAITAALAALGPGGMIGGIAFLGIMGLISHTVAEFGTEAVVKAVVREQLKSKTKETIINQIRSYPLTKGLRLKVIDYVEKAAAQ